MTNDPSALADEVLLDEVRRIVVTSARSTAELVAHLAEVDRRRLYLGLGHPSMFAYCTERLGLAEGSAYNRIEVARLSRRFPLVLELLAGGHVNLNNLRLLGPHLTDENHRELLAEVCGKTRSAVELMVVRFQPRPAVAPTLRRMPVAPAAPPPVRVTGAPRPVTPLAPELFRLTVTMDGPTRERWQALRDRLAGDDAAVLAKAVEIALAELERARRATTPRVTGENSRHIPEVVRRVVEKRDGGRCAFVGSDGRRCAARRQLQCHHVKPWSNGGPSTEDNLQLRCAAHNRYEADLFFAAARNSPRGESPQARTTLVVSSMSVAREWSTEQ